MSYFQGEDILKGEMRQAINECSPPAPRKPASLHRGIDEVRLTPGAGSEISVRIWGNVTIYFPIQYYTGITARGRQYHLHA